VKIVLDRRSCQHLITTISIVIIVNKGESEMKLSTRTRYGVRLMLALARNYERAGLF
jgi:hypothetical protein